MTKFLRNLAYSVFGILVCLVLLKTQLSNTTAEKAEIHAEIITVEHGYGYQILIGEKLLVKQQFIPAINGEVAFQTRNDAKKVADLVKTKLINRLNPEVSLEDLVNLNIQTWKCQPDLWF
nr:DUF4907 domain-containing protein [uncultured Allomuricauda sp.]